MSTKTPTMGMTAPAITDEVTNSIPALAVNFTFLDAIFPIGTYYFSDNSTDPSTFRGGTWTQITDGRVIAACSAAHPAGTTTGEETHTLTVDEMPKHTHPSSVGNTLQNHVDSSGGTAYGYILDGSYEPTESAGGGKAHNNMQPTSFVYAWKRTA